MKLGSVKLFVLLCFLLSSMCAIAENSQNYAKVAHEFFKKQEYLKSGGYYEKAYNQNKQKVYLENAITAYLNYSFDCLNEKNYAQCIKYCEKVLKISPGNTNAKEILSDAYYSRGSKNYYMGNKKIAECDLQNSLKYSVLREQKERARDMLSQKHGREIYFQKSNIKKATNKSSLPELLETMELKIYGQTFEQSSLKTRISKLEKDVLGRNYSNYGLLLRVDNLKKRVLPELMRNKG